MPGRVVLRSAGVAVVLDVDGASLPRVVHWGADLGELDDGAYAALPGVDGELRPRGSRSTAGTFTLSPTRAQGWPGWPGLTGHRDGTASQPLFAPSGADHHDLRLNYRGTDEPARLRLDGELELMPSGVLRQRQRLTSTAAAGESPYTVGDLLTLLPVPEHVVDVVDHAGRWSKEAQQQRLTLHQGS
ncbi:MAG: glycoside hydrolase family 36 N-terminal domain-containing protein, partial [Jatrophihabitantaceae bacterium]